LHSATCRESIAISPRIMPARSHPYRQFARQALVEKVSTATPDHTQVAEGFKSLRQRLAETLVPIFGATAIDALFERSRHLAVQEFAWITDVLSADRGPHDIDMPTVAPITNTDEMFDGLGAVLAHDIGLLAALVGKDLILPLVGKAWGTIGRLRTGGESD
jgi:hypothetical protein